ncbi:hypothetical protein ACPOL_6183 [Acidisarcina polymorpha]|uniref:Uncharacterized protein n=1 Tax=Acidisarcina polymorpha TaxID=2211140 RepID=A0A2Z5G9D1_9BACT|nr:hypothetical protein ACPOL_6183 [Acidisarcina polymorpha]
MCLHTEGTAVDEEPDEVVCCVPADGEFRVHGRAPFLQLGTLYPGSKTRSNLSRKRRAQCECGRTCSPIPVDSGWLRGLLLRDGDNLEGWRRWFRKLDRTADGEIGTTADDAPVVSETAIDAADTTGGQTHGGFSLERR